MSLAAMAQGARAASLRRAGGGGGGGTDPTTVAGLSALWTVDSLSSTDGTEILSFPSTGGSGTTMTMIEGAGAGPIYHTAVQNGLPVIRSDTTRNLFTSSSMSPAVSTTNTVFLAARMISITSGASLLDGDTPNTYRLYFDSTTTLTIFTGSTQPTSYTLPSPTGWHVFAVRRSGTATNGLQLWVDGLMKSQVTASATTSSTQMRMFSGVSPSANADIGELVTYHTTALSDADMLGVTRFLGAKWGIAVA